MINCEFTLDSPSLWDIQVGSEFAKAIRREEDAILYRKIK